DSYLSLLHKSPKHAEIAQNDCVESICPDAPHVGGNGYIRFCFLVCRLCLRCATATRHEHWQDQRGHYRHSHLHLPTDGMRKIIPRSCSTHDIIRPVFLDHYNETARGTPSQVIDESARRWSLFFFEAFEELATELHRHMAIPIQLGPAALYLYGVA